jgi:hypothetical protein
MTSPSNTVITAEFQPYTRLPNAVYELLEECHIDVTQFLILAACYRWLNRSTNRVDSFSAERVCMLYRWDATDARLKSVRRAVLDLVDRQILSRDYRKGDKRPYHVWLTGVTSPEIESLSLQSHVRDNVRDAETVTVVDAHTSVESVTDSVRETAPLLSVTNQGAERDSLEGSASQHSSLGGITPKTPSPTRDFQSLGTHPGGRTPSLPSCEGKPFQFPEEQRHHRKALTQSQCNVFDNLVSGFRTGWTQNWSFDPDDDDARRLLRACSPYEIEAAYSELWQGGRVRNSTMAAFFNRSALNMIQCRRREGISLKTHQCYGQWGLSADLERAWHELFDERKEQTK